MNSIHAAKVRIIKATVSMFVGLNTVASSGHWVFHTSSLCAPTISDFLCSRTVKLVKGRTVRQRQNSIARALRQPIPCNSAHPEMHVTPSIGITSTHHLQAHWIPLASLRRDHDWQSMRTGIGAARGQWSLHIQNACGAMARNGKCKSGPFEYVSIKRGRPLSG